MWSSDFLGNKKADDYKELVAELLSSFQDLGCNMSIKVLHLKSHLDSFPEILGPVSDEQGERFHQEIKVMEYHCQGRWNIYMIAEYCWSLVRHKPQVSQKQNALKQQFVFDWLLQRSFILMDCYSDCVFG